jgi:hypothetical protein
MNKILLIILISLSFSQIQYSGYVSTEGKVRHKNGELIDVPYRLGELKFSYTFANIDFITNSYIEGRNETIEAEFNLKEIYIGWYPSFGEIRIGNQVNTWGYADGNNPTDNLNPYDFNYLFLTGTDRKVATFSMAFETYLNDHKLGLVLIPQHKPNRFPIDDADFKMDDNEVPPSINEDEFQWGVSFQSMIGESDYMLTYFNGYDFSPAYAGKIHLFQNYYEPKFEYRKTHVFGLSTVSFWNDATLRSETAYFLTNTAETVENSADYQSEYLQYVYQIEYPTDWDVTINAQLVGNKMISVSGKNYVDREGVKIVQANEDNFNMGLGTPFASFTENTFLLSFQKTFFDDTIELDVINMKNISASGNMFAVGIEYSPIENVKIELSSSIFDGGDEGSPTVFSALEDFSHSTLRLKYSF